MEYDMVKSALKSCVLRDTAPFVQSQNQLVSDDGFGADDVFPVDDLLIDFLNEGRVGDGKGSFQEKEKEDLGSISSYDDGGVFDDDDGTSDFICFSSQLAIPDDDLAGLEWVSQFVDDSLPELPVLYPIKPSALEPGSMYRSEPVLVEHPRFPANVPVKARSKRPRIARREHPLPSDSSSSSGNSSSSCLSFAGGALSSGKNFGSGQDEPGRKRRKSNRPVRTGGPQFQRWCSHCQAQRTPQWRAGPLGPKTLCNACGVRYKSGRLLPEYRPACSPTFSMEIHSNSHRKVLEMRRRKDVDGIGCGSEGGCDLAQVVRSCLKLGWAN